MSGSADSVREDGTTPASSNKKLFAVAVLAFIAGVALGTYVGRTTGPVAEAAAADTPSRDDSLNLTVRKAADGWAVTNHTDYVLNLCWAERSWRRGSVPTMMPGATVVVRHEAFQPSTRANPTPGWRITCASNGYDILAFVREMPS